MKFSDEQQKIIDAELNNNLVSASAGSGKTTVLTARIGEEVKSGKLSVDGMLVVTFTEDAASHMADKIEDKIRSLRNEAGTPEEASYLSSQIDLLPNAYIQTMHGFCSRVIKEKGYILEDGPMADFTDPSCRILSSSEQEVLLQNAVDYAIQAMYEECDSEDDDFISFTRRFGDGRSDGSLVGIVTSTYTTLRSLPDYIEKCEELIQKREQRDREGKIMFFEGDNDIPRVIVEYLASMKAMILDSEFDSVLECHDTYQIVKDMSNEEFIGELISRIDHALEHYETHKGADFFESLTPLKELGEHDFNNMFRNADFRGDDKAFLAVVSLRHFISPGKWDDIKFANSYDLPQECSFS